MKHNGGGPATRAAQVLIVDDNQDAAMSLLMLLELEDIAATTAPTGAAALEMLRSMRPSLLLIDIGLPGMSGYELAQRLRQQAELRETTLIALTGRDVGSEPPSEAAVFDQFWTKPFDPKKLLAEVKQLLGRAAA